MSVSDGPLLARSTPSGYLSVIERADQNRASTRPGVFLSADTIFIGVSDGSGRLLSLGGDFFALSPTGADMLRRLLECPMEVVQQELVRDYEVSPGRITDDLEGLLIELQRRDLVSTETVPSKSRRKYRIDPSALLFPLLRRIWRMPADRKGSVWQILALARIACRLWGWSPSVSCWRQFLAQFRIGRVDGGAVDRAAAIDATLRRSAARHPMGMGCKERALACWFLLYQSNIIADLILGVNLYPLASHCWCEWRNNVYGDDPIRCYRYEEILRYRICMG